MKKWVFTSICAIIPLLTFPQNTFSTKGRYLLDPNGEKVVLRGVNEMFIWSSDIDGSETFPEIAKTGANVVRIVWMSDDDDKRATAENLDEVITNCVKNGMVAIPELHGATGKWDNLNKMVDYWIKPEVVAVIKKHENHVLLNIANEAGKYDIKKKEFEAVYELAVKRIRAAGIKCPLVIDASGWGQDLDILLECGHDLISKDPLQNLLFSVHMWWVANDGSTSRIKEGLAKSVEIELPLIVGEFAPMGPGCKESIDYKTIMEECENREIGWLAWSWGLVNNGDCKLMDMTSDKMAGKFDGLERWGREVAVTNKYSIKNTSKKTRFFEELAQ